MRVDDLRQELRKQKDPAKARILQRFFKTGKGEYGEEDQFFGIPVPVTRRIVRKYHELPLSDAEQLLASPIHEERLAALLLLVHLFQAGDDQKKKEIYQFYLRNTAKINNWDLVDLSAEKIVGVYLLYRSKAILSRLARSPNIWERRIAIIATYAFIKNGRFEETLKIAQILLRDSHDLIHKAVGWMLREVGNRSMLDEEAFLKKHYRHMPRTMLRYAIEKFPEKKRQAYLRGDF